MAVKSYNYKGRPRHTYKSDRFAGDIVNITFNIEGESETGPEIFRFDTTIRYFDTGDTGGETLLLVHGIGQSLFTWRQNIDFFADCGYRVIAMDLAGCGFSGHPNIYYTVEENALVIGAFLDAMGIERAHIGAFSTGALSALVYAHSNPGTRGPPCSGFARRPNETIRLLRALTTWLGRTLFLMHLSETAVRNVLSDLVF